MKWKLATVLLLFSSLAQAETLNLEQYLVRVKQKHHLFLAINNDLQAAEYISEAAYLDLSPMLTARVGYLDDKKPFASGLLTVVHNKTTDYSLGISKKFITGTTLAVNASTYGSDLELSTPAAVTSGYAGLAFTITQSLWKDGLGSNTRMKLQQAQNSQRSAVEGFNLQAKLLLVQAENAFWDFIYQDQEVKSKQANLERAKKIEQWVKNRASNGIGDRSDTLSAQGLRAGRELELITALDDLQGAKQQIINVLEIKEGEEVPLLMGHLEQIREPSAFIQGTEGKIVKLDAYISVLDARAKKLSADQAADSVKPDLQLEGKYSTNAIEPSLGESMGKISNTDIPTTSVALKLVWMLDGSAKNAVSSVARAAALTSEMKMQRSLLESGSAWSEYTRKHQEFAKKVEQATILSKIQTERAAQERDKLSKGRSITQQVILAEQDAADAELRLSKLKAEMRKFEAQANMYVRLPNQELL